MRSYIIKKIIAAACCLVLATGSVSAYADDTVTSGNYSYRKLTDTTAELVKCVNQAETDTLIIPAEIDGLKVTSIAENFLDKYSAYDTVVFPTTVTELKKHTINLSDVKCVIIPPNVSTIANNALYTKAMRDAMREKLKAISGGEASEIEIIPLYEIDLPVGSIFTVRYSSGSEAESYSKALGAVQTELKDYKGLAGDIDLNGKVNNRDLKALQKYLSGDGSVLLTPALDVDGNGVLNNRDIKRLQQHLVSDKYNIY